MFTISGKRGITGNDPSSWFGSEERKNNDCNTDKYVDQLLLIGLS